MKKIFLSFVAFGLFLISLYFGVTYLGSFLRSVVSEEPVAFTVSVSTYDCADGNCIGFTVASSNVDVSSSYVGKLIIPYSETFTKDQLQSQWSHLLKTPGQVVCIKGYVHEYPVNTLRLFQSGYGGYRFRLTDYSEGSCG